MAFEMQDKMSALKQKMGVNSYEDYGADESTFVAADEYMGDCFKTVDKLSTMISTISENVEKIKHNHNVILSSVQNPKVKEETDSLMDEITSISHRLQKGLTSLKEEVEADEKGPQRNTADFRIKKAQFQTLSRKFRDVMSEYSQVQAEYRDKCKDRIQRQLKYTGKQVTEEEMEEMLQSDNAAVFTQDILIDTAQKRQALGEIEARHQEILDLEENIKELHEMFYELALMVEDQGEIINRIEYNVETAAVHVDVARKDVKIASEYHNTNTKLRWCICIVVTVTIIALLIAIAIISGVVYTIVRK